MTDVLSKADLDIIQKVGKEIVCCLLPDELPFFDAIWRAIAPILRDRTISAKGNAECKSLLEHRMSELSFAASWSADASFMMAPITMVLGRALDNAIHKGVYSEDEIGRIVAESSLGWHLPGRFLRVIQMFVASICTSMAKEDKELEDLLRQARSMLPHSLCYYVFHAGAYQYYAEALPADMLALREKVLFWADKSNHDYRSLGNRREKNEWLSPRAERMLRYLCLAENVGRSIRFQELYSRVWQADDQIDASKIKRDIDVVQNELNTFSHKCFIADESRKNGTMGSAKVKRIHGMDTYVPTVGAPEQCCIITEFRLAE